MATRHDWYKAAALALRDRIVHRWLTAEKQSYDAGRKRVYYLSLEFLIGRLFTDALNNMGLLPVFETALGDLGVGLAGLAQMRAGCRARQWRPRAASCVLHGKHGDAGDPRDRLRHPLRFRPVPPDHQQWLAAGISRRMAELRQPLGIPAAGSGLSRAFRRRRRTCRGQGTRPRDLASGRDRAGGRLRHPDRRLARPARQRAAAVVGALARSAEARRLQHRRLSRRQRRGSARRIDLQVPLSERREPGRARAAAAPGIFLRLGLAAGSGQASSGGGWANTQPRAKGRGAAQRHPPQSRRHRADAHPGRSSQHPLGRCVEDHGRDAVLHQPHAAAGSARDLAGRAVRTTAAAPSGDHLPHQCRASRAARRRAAPATSISAPRSR